ncbi:MAG: T9SS type A sorting domain-containing protein [Bacteroidetes bacterium]|nr:T9SS type A sorting domain-containing protein [Bacteroidota bacterium]MCW5896030.1 T9SS type A sorting domain-containing protein [Bacteroidota bacterium]
MKLRLLWVAMAAAVALSANAQDSVDVTFRYNITGFPGGISVPGQFNGWNNTAWPMSYQGGTLWTRNARLAVGGNPGGPIVGAYQYKFYYNGASPWPNDPLNHHFNPSDNDNSFIIVKDPTIYHLLPNQRTSTVSTARPTISAFIFPKVGSTFDTTQLSLIIDGNTISGIGSSYDFASKQMNYTLTTDLANGGHTVILQAGATRDTVNFVVQVGGPIQAQIPPYAKHGVTLPSPASNDSTTFRLRVGATNFVAVRVAPLGQPVAGAPPVIMRKNFTSDDWWINISLPPGTYEYQFQTGSGNPFNDPWGRFNGTYGTRFTIGPEGLTADDYVWQSTSYQRPPLNKLVIYEMNVAEFVGGYLGLPSGQIGTFTQLANMMGYFDSLGINAIELMPVNDYALIGRSGFSWGYDLSHHFALEPAYGTPRDFKVLVDSAHARGIAIIVDVVFNHLNDPGPLWAMQPDVTTNPYFKLCADLRYNEDQLCFFRDMDHWTNQTQEYVYEVLKMWIDEYRVDGFRYDFTQGIGWNINEPTRGILGWANRIAQEYQGQIYQIAEHLPESPALVFHSGMTGGWHDSFRDEIFDEARFRNRSLVNFENLVIDLGAYPGNDIPATPSSYANRTEPVNATVTHDEQSLIFEMTTFQSVPLAEALLRDKLYGTFIFASLGIPMLWQGMEHSEPRGWQTDNQKLLYRPVQFGFRGTQRGQEHYAWYSTLIRQRKYNPALYQGALIRLFRYTAQKTLVWGFQDVSSNARFVAVANLSGAQQTVTNVPWLGSGTFYDILDQSTLEVSGSNVASMTLPAYTARCYTNLPDSVLLEVKPVDHTLPAEYALGQNYPNPFNPSTTINFRIKESGYTTLTVYDVLGREVEKLVSNDLQAGSYSVEFIPRNLSSGVYLYRLTSGSYVETKKLMLTK